MLGSSLTIRLLYNENRGEWVIAPSDETVSSRTFHKKKATAKGIARRMAKKHNGVLEIYTRDGTLQESLSYEPDKTRGDGFTLPGF